MSVLADAVVTLSHRESMSSVDRKDGDRRSAKRQRPTVNAPTTGRYRNTRVLLGYLVQELSAEGYRRRHAVWTSIRTAGLKITKSLSHVAIHPKLQTYQTSLYTEPIHVYQYHHHHHHIMISAKTTSRPKTGSTKAKVDMDGQVRMYS